MKYYFVMTIFALFFFQTPVWSIDLEEAQNKILSNYVDPMAITKIENFVKEGIEAKKENPKFLMEEEANSSSCGHCPKHMELANSVNNIVEAMKKNPDVAKHQEVPLAINRLRFMFYQIKSRDEDGTVSCTRYRDITPDLRPTKLDGDMELMAQDVFKFNAVASAQLIDPSKEEIIYYYRGEGNQKNIIVQAVLTKDGGKFRYYYYRPTEKEKNPYNLPSMGHDESADDATIKKKKYTGPEMKMTEQDKIDSRNTFDISVDPALETRLAVLPTNLKIAKGTVSQGVNGTGLRLNAGSSLSLKGNEANINIQSEEGKKFVELDVATGLDGVTTAKVTVPYEVRLSTEDKPESVKVKGKFEEEMTQQAVTLALTSGSIEHVKTQWKRDKNTMVETYAISRGFNITKDEKLTFEVGRNEEKNKYVSFQAATITKKKDISMVLDVRVDENRKASLRYTLQSRF